MGAQAGFKSSSEHRGDGDAERALLSACFHGGRRVVEEALEVGVDVTDFNNERLGSVFASMVRLVDADKTVDVLQVVEDLTTHAQLDAVGGAAACSQLDAQDLRVERVADLARLVVDHAAFRRTSAAAQEIGSLARARAMPAVELISLAQTTFLDLNAHMTGNAEIVDRPSLVAEVLASSGKVPPGSVSTGFPALDDLLGGGCRAGTTTIIAGRPGMAKTALAVAMASTSTDMGIPVGFFSLEMPAQEIIAREISSYSGIAKRDWDINRENRARVAEAAAFVNDRPLHIIDRPGLTAAEISAATRRMKARHGIGALFVDHIGKVRPSDRYAGDKNNETGETSEALRALAGTLEIPIIALSQLNRAVEGRKDRRAGLADLRDSGTLEQDAHAVIFPFRPEYYLKEKTPEAQQGLCELDLAKNRDGPVGTVRVRFNSHTQRFSPRFER